MNRELHEPHESFTLSASNVERDGVRCRNGHAIPVFATAAPAVILAPMPTLENNATQPWLISQSDIVAEVGRRLSVVERLATVVSATSDKSRDSVLQRAARLRQSILQQAFTGQLT